MKSCENCDSDIMNEYPDHECKKCVERLRAELAAAKAELGNMKENIERAVKREVNAWTHFDEEANEALKVGVENKKLRAELEETKKEVELKTVWYGNIPAANVRLRAELEALKRSAADAIIIERPEDYADVHRDLLLADFCETPSAFGVRWLIDRSEE
ncbi:hypothetical protein [Candidatus Magnetobacterium casense]|uniref:Uncharacterized protein n=1 Tax=Candidatus Magnetobacterium casense TaxID=1455061 RepID=A0ABS6RWG3_9BACT|nr:hypothetical protein [Candidatus Magnetobacterium casensis]MBV6340967.1 hypothetical protein [Candidatus Magnetobacterium casensis]